MADEENIKSARLTPEEAEFLDKNKISFTDLVRESLNTKQKETSTTNKKQILNKLMTNGVFAIIGLCFLSALSFQSNFFTITIVGGLGGFFAIVGSINLYLTIREINQGKPGKKKNAGK